MNSTHPGSATDYARLLQTMLDATIAAGGLVADYVQHGFTVEHKADKSAVTTADLMGEAVILAALAHAAPQIPVIAEEEFDEVNVPEAKDRFFLVDALDGTKEFISGGTDFTVNVALIEGGVPTLGVVYAPARSHLYWGNSLTREAWFAEQPPHGPRAKPVRIAVRPPSSTVRAVASKSHSTPETEAWLRASKIADRVSIGSSLKFVLVASGEADVYPRAAPTMEWDTGAGDAVLRAAGGRVLDLDGNPLLYGKPDFRNPGFVATGLYDPAPLRPFMQSARSSEFPR